jgi:uncharacterized SAM-binding protein YcdF (DUF218 family)
VPVTVLVPGYGGRLVVSGRNGEAERLAALAPRDVPVSIETTARSTQENVERSLPLLAGSEKVAIASDRFHQRRALRHLQQAEPQLVAAVVPPTYGWREGWWMDACGAVHETMLHVRRAMPRPSARDRR